MVPETQGGGFGQFQRFQAIITVKREREREREKYCGFVKTALELEKGSLNSDTNQVFLNCSYPHFYDL